jgi:Flp pilus assembly protein TadG
MTAPRTTGLHERGSSIAEFAIVLTAALTLIMGIVDFGRGLYTYHLIANAARLGTRYAIVRGGACSTAGCPATQTSIQTYVRSLAPELNPASMTVTTTWSQTSSCTANPANTAGCLVNVQVVYPFRFIALPLLPNYTMSIASTSQMIISQ